jgi:hypothetical protein
MSVETREKGFFRVIKEKSFEGRENRYLGTRPKIGQPRSLLARPANRVRFRRKSRIEMGKKYKDTFFVTK